MEKFAYWLGCFGAFFTGFGIGGICVLLIIT